MAASVTMTSECEAEELYQQLHEIRPEFTKDDYLGENGWDLDAMQADLALMRRQDKEDGEKLFMQLSAMDSVFERCDYLQNGEWDIAALRVDIQAVKQEQETRFPQERKYTVPGTVTQFDQDQIAARTVRMQGDTTGVIVDTFGQEGFLVDTNEGRICDKDGTMVDASASHMVNTDMGLGEIIDTCGDDGFVVDLGANIHVADPTGDMVNLPEDSVVVRSGPIPVPVVLETNSAEAVVDDVVDMMSLVPEVECLPEPMEDDVMAQPAMQMLSRGISEPIVTIDEQLPMTEEITTEPVTEPALPATKLMTEPVPMTEEMPATEPAMEEEQLSEVCQDTMVVSSDERINEKIDPAFVAEVPAWAVPRKRRRSSRVLEAQKARSKRRVSKKKKSSKKNKTKKKSLKKKASRKRSTNAGSKKSKSS